MTSQRLVYHPSRTLPTKLGIMSSILLSASPVNNLRTFNKSAPRYLRGIKKEDYYEAAFVLEQANIGVLDVNENNKRSVLFIKRVPVEVKDILEERFSALCSYWAYEQRFYLPVPSSMRLSLERRRKMHDLGIKLNYPNLSK